MRIAVVLGLLQEQYPFQSWYQMTLVAKLATAYPQTEILLVVSNNNYVPTPLPANITLQQIPARKDTYLSQAYWYNTKLPLALRKWKPDVFLQAGTRCSTVLRTPQLWWYHEPVVTTPVKYLASLYEKRTQHVIGKSAAAASAVHLTHITHIPQVAAKAITLPVTALPQIQPLNYEQREQVKDGYTDSREYFLVLLEKDTLSQFTNLLKAFSRFKKWQQSNMKLVFIGLAPDAATLQKLSSYKYREDVVMVTQPDGQQLQALLSAAYALLYLPAYTQLAPVVNTMQAEVPVVVFNNEPNVALLGDTVMYGNAADIEQLSHQMIQLYKDETGRSRMIQRAAQWLQQRSLDNLLHELYDALQKLVQH